MLNALPVAASAQVWADLGCGKGTFTKALAELLPAGSIIHAVDRDVVALAQLPERWGSAGIVRTHADFSKEELPVNELDGILMANALHYVKDQVGFVARVATHLKPYGSFVLVEYDTDEADPWVPYPIPSARLQVLFAALGTVTVARMAERGSVFGRVKLYSALIMRERSRSEGGGRD